MKNALILFSAIFAIALVAIGGYYLVKKSPGLNRKNQVAIPMVVSKFTSTPTVTITQRGTIEGSLGFPSEGIPENMQVCAENIQTDQTFCTNYHIKDYKHTYGIGYKLEVPGGSYFVYAQVPGFGDGYKAYYNEFVTCGLSVDCPSHKPIEVNVNPDATLTGVDPQDWYDQQP